MGKWRDALAFLKAREPLARLWPVIPYPSSYRVIASFPLTVRLGDSAEGVPSSVGSSTTKDVVDSLYRDAVGRKRFDRAESGKTLIRKRN